MHIRFGENMENSEWYREESKMPFPLILLPRTLVVLVASIVSDSCDAMDYSLPGCSVHGISQARMLEWVAISFSRESQHRDWTCVSCIGRQILYTEPPGKSHTEHPLNQSLLWDFPGGPVFKNLCSMQGMTVQSLVRELTPTCPGGNWACMP